MVRRLQQRALHSCPAELSGWFSPVTVPRAGRGWNRSPWRAGPPGPPRGGTRWDISLHHQSGVLEFARRRRCGQDRPAPDFKHIYRELNRTIARQLSWLHNRPLSKLDGTQRTLYEELDRPALLPLPARRFVIPQWKTDVGVNIDDHVEFARHYYSVPQLSARHHHPEPCPPTPGSRHAAGPRPGGPGTQQAGAALR